jgi:hypothetical protein
MCLRIQRVVRAFVSLLAATFAFSQVSPAQDEALRARVDSLEQQVLGLQKAAAETKTPQKQQSPGPIVIMSGLIFTNYSYSPKGGADWPSMNKFDFDRVYLTAKSTLTEEWKVQVTTDIFRTSNVGSGAYYNGLSFRLKFALLEYTPDPAWSIKAGAIPNVWTGFSESLWKYRGIAKVPTDKNGYFSTADLGISAAYSLPNKVGELTASILNGNNFENPDTNRFKDIGVRASLAPFGENPALKSLVFGAHCYLGSNGTPGGPALERNRFGGIVGYSYSVISANIEYDIKQETPVNPNVKVSGNLLSVFGEVRSPAEGWWGKLAAVWRVDLVEPNVDVTGDKTTFVIAGLSYKINDKVMLVLDQQAVFAESKTLTKYDKTKVDFDQKYFVHAIIAF